MQSILFSELSFKYQSYPSFQYQSCSSFKYKSYSSHIHFTELPHGSSHLFRNAVAYYIQLTCFTFLIFPMYTIFWCFVTILMKCISTVGTTFQYVCISMRRLVVHIQVSLSYVYIPIFWCFVTILMKCVGTTFCHDQYVCIPV